VELGRTRNFLDELAVVLADQLVVFPVRLLAIAGAVANDMARSASLEGGLFRTGGDRR
jgi:hypothetical protein